MRRVFAFIFSLFSMALLADIPFPYTNISEGEFLGGGTFQKSDGFTGEYHSYLVIEDGQIRMDQVFLGQSMSYLFTLDINDFGFFDVEVTKSQASGDATFEGNGYCIEGNCHYYVNFGYGFVEETLIFKANKIHKVGSIHIQNTEAEEGEYNVTVWTEDLYKLIRDEGAVAP